MTNYPPRSEYICRVIDLVAELAQEEHGAVLCHPQEPVVRCKDCKLYEPPTERHLEDAYIKLPGRCKIVRQYIQEVSPNGFCAWGERVEGSKNRGGREVNEKSTVGEYEFWRLAESLTELSKDFTELADWIRGKA